ncbi:MAG: 4-alpha-glucanotransferase [Campylobacterota bacterium]|nr:4-alpha-glucanotransferase [Campylobacterota bacterium]
MTSERRSGILLHPTSLPSPYGIGDFGPSAYAFIDFLKASGQSIWQILPLGQTGYGNSPYQTLSAFGGNPLLISPQLLIDEGLLEPIEIPRETFDTSYVEYDRLDPYKTKLLRRAYFHYKLHPKHPLDKQFKSFCEKEAYWLEDYVLFFALKAHHDDKPWNLWPSRFRDRDPEALDEYRKKLKGELHWYRFVQFLFFRQFEKLKAYAGENGIKIVGDLPIFVAHDSSDVWSRPELFYLKPDRSPRVVAGVPPDYFSATGQRWGNPLYDWKEHRREKYAFWTDRIRHSIKLFDLIRLDHFRGFADYWEIPADEETAVKGKWRKGPGIHFFRALEKALERELPIIAEDLGIITDDVVALLNKLGYPGMAILQFGYESRASSDPSSFLPHNLTKNQVVYTGTHDNDTVVGWWNTQPEEVKDFTRRYLNTDGNLIHRDMIRAAFSTVCHTAIFPMQDLLGLGSEAKMNRPGTTEGNWQWRMAPDVLSTALEEDLLMLTQLYGR